MTSCTNHTSTAVRHMAARLCTNFDTLVRHMLHVDSSISACLLSSVSLSLSLSTKTHFLGRRRVLTDGVTGSLSTSATSNLLTFQDNLTKFVGACPLTNETSEAIAEQPVERVILRFGMPEIILTDNASNFTSDVMHNVYKLLGIKKCTTSPYHP